MNHRPLFLRYLAQTSAFPLMLEIAHAKGIYMYDQQGKPYLDLISGIGVSNIGHGHPKVLEAIKAQAEQHLHLMVYGELVHAPQSKLAEALCQTLPRSLDNVFLVNSGSEATEGALKLAKRHTGRSQILSCYQAYHGATHGALSVCGNEDFKQAFRPLLPHVAHFRFGNLEDLALIDAHTAAVIIEPIQGEAGVHQADVEYFKQLRKACSQNGALLVLDEAQTGFGRTGKFWAFEHYGITPDILLCAKAMGGGMPLGAFISSKQIMQDLTHDPVLGHITTFGGHPVSAVAALAALQVLQQDKLYETAEEKGQLFQSLLVHPKIKEVRGRGLMIAVVFDSFELLNDVLRRLLDQGILSDWFLFCDHAMRIAPPLTITQKEIEKVCDEILQALSLH